MAVDAKPIEIGLRLLTDVAAAVSSRGPGHAGSDHSCSQVISVYGASRESRTVTPLGHSFAGHLAVPHKLTKIANRRTARRPAIDAGLLLLGSIDSKQLVNRSLQLDRVAIDYGLGRGRQGQSDGGEGEPATEMQVADVPQFIAP